MWMVSKSQFFDPFCMLQLTWPTWYPFAGSSELAVVMGVDEET